MSCKDLIPSLASQRRSIRRYSSEYVELNDVLYAISTALQAPLGANTQPWRFIIIDDPNIKKEVRRVCEEGEKRFL